MPNIMVDLETLGTTPGCTILSIGAVAFSTRERTLGEEFYCVISRKSCEDAGLEEAQDTLAWWMKQSPAARQVLFDADTPEVSVDLRTALSKYSAYLARNGGKKAFVYGNGADFDNPILNVAAHKAGVTLAQGNFNGRCYRSLKEMWGLLGVPKPPAIVRGSGTHHNALDDAKAQALHAIEVVNHYRSFIHG